MSKVDIDEIAKKNPRLAEGVRRADEMNGHQSHAGPKQPDGKTPHDRRKLSTIWADDIEINLDGGGLIDGLLGTAGMTVLYGDSGVGKTFVAIDIACHIAAGLPWRDMTVEQGLVLYIAAEAAESVKRRLWAWKRRHEVDRLPVLVVQSSVDLLNGDADAVVELVADTTQKHGRIALIVVDTLARAMTGNENSPEDMGRFVAACGRIREAAGGHLVTVHHSGKNSAAGARGHSSLRAATDVELEVTQENGAGCVKVTKHRDEAGGTSYGFKLEIMEIGTNPKGRVITTCVAAAADAPKPARRDGPKRRQLNDKGKNVMEAVTKAAKYVGAPPPFHPETEGVTHAVKVAQARACWRELMGWEDADQKTKDNSRQDWFRGVENAKAAGSLGSWGGYLWVRR